jgi:transposase
VLRTGCQWQMIPERQFGVSGSTCWHRFDEWTRAGVWPAVHHATLNELGLAGKVDLSAAVVDSQSVRAVFGGAYRAQPRRPPQERLQTARDQRRQRHTAVDDDHPGERP